MSIKGSHPSQVGLVVGFLLVAILDSSPACAEDKTTLLVPYTEYVIAQGIVGAHGHKFTLATCPPTSVVVGGGFSAEPGVVVYDQFMFGNGWYGTARNDHSVPKEMTTFAVCLHNVPGAFVTENQYEIGVLPSYPVYIEFGCPAGSIVTGGGFRLDSDGGLIVYENIPGSYLNGWRVGVKNITVSPKTLRVYATCLWGSGGSRTLGEESINVDPGYFGAVATCPGDALVTAGGFYDPSADLLVYASWGPYSDYRWLVSGWNGDAVFASPFTSLVACLDLGLDLGRIFSDGFDLGNTRLWSGTVP